MLTAKGLHFVQSPIVLLTDSKIYGRNVHSVSKEVHEEIVKHLAGVIKSE